MEKNYKVTKTRAIKLRKLGLSYGEISRKTQVSKSTLSLWLKGVELKPEQKKRLYTKQTLILNSGPQSQKNRRMREVDAIIKSAASEIKTPIPLSAYRLFGTALYWAEGSKSQMFGMTNSDPNLILFWVTWLNKIFKVSPQSLKAALNIYPQQDELSIKRFWSDLTGIPVENFGKSYVKPLSKNYKTNNLYYGTIRIVVPRSTNLRHIVYAWQTVVLKEISPKVEIIERRWDKLRTVVKPVNLD